jgi:hypothetical protein
MYLSAEFRAKAAVAETVRRLRESGFGSEAIALFSDEPLELPASVLPRPSRMSLVAVSGAVLLGLLTISFVYYTQHDYPLRTGGMPIFSFWATGVVFYELTMLGAILSTFAWFLFESGLLRRRRKPVPSIEPGRVSLRVECGAAEAERAMAVLTETGAENVHELGARA